MLTASAKYPLRTQETHLSINLFILKSNREVLGVGGCIHMQFAVTECFKVNVQPAVGDPASAGGLD